MGDGGQIGAANSDGVEERVAFVERNWTRLRGSRKHKPHFWHDVEVRRFLIAEHGFMTMDMARAQTVRRFGTDRAPSRTAIGRFWQALDKLTARP